MSATFNMSRRPVHGIVAEFDEPEPIIAAAEKAKQAGYTKLEAYTPFPVPGLDEALGMSNTRMGWVVLLAGMTGGLLGFLMQWYANVIFYPLNIGGTPLNSWPRFIVITFELTVLFSAFTSGLFMLARNGLPHLHHAIFNTPNFENATTDRFFLCIEAKDKKFDSDKVKALLQALESKPLNISEVSS